MSELEAALKIFGSIHDLISSHDEGLRLSREVYSHVRTCFDMLYEFIGVGEKSEWSYHGEHEAENWKLRDSVYKEYEAMMQTVEMELRGACVSYHKLPTRLLDYKPYCAFMETYRMCMNDRGKAAYPTETEEKYLPLVVDGRMWTQVCAESQEEIGFKNVYLEHKLKYNAKLKDLVVKLAIHRRLNRRKYQFYGSVVEGFHYALIDVLNIVQSKYRNESKTKTHEQMDKDVESYIKGELVSYASYTGSQGIVSTAKTLAEVKRSDLLRELYALCV
jgi:hypothetical protein